ncbi:hypothetical protein HPB52_003042 [Rhipicephalus sanguineus]|uniref:Uncharacterized protein n=1 Tax=Rhipicephalus sanguineus TaxID=34632 RepID=A0A9D4PQ08_RHISA|nr:hypothetical protein HPB52_003042 [Rhipicephalus sanguineus]
MGQICALDEELVPEARCPIRPSPPHQQHPDVHLELDNLSKRRTPACELHHQLKPGSRNSIHRCRHSCLQSWLEEFEAALELNNIWLQEFQFQVLEYYLPRDLKRHLTYFSWSPRPYDYLRHAVLQSYGIRHRPFPKSDPVPSDKPSSTWTHSTPWPVQTVPLPTTGYTGDGDHPPVPIDPLTERPTILESTAPASDVPVLSPEPLAHLSITDSTPATAPCTIAFAAESCATPLAAQGDLTITDESADLAAEHTPVLIPVEARDTAYTTVAKPAFALHASRLANTSAPAAQALVVCQPDHDLSSNALNGSQSFPDVPARISFDLSQEPHPTTSCLPPTHAPSGVERLHQIYAQRPTRGPSRTYIALSTGALLSALKKPHRARVGLASTRAFAPFPPPDLQRTSLRYSLLLVTCNHRGPLPLRGSLCRLPEQPDSLRLLP